MSDGPEVLNDSLCQKCVYRVRRVVVPINNSDWHLDIYDQEEYIDALENGEEIKFEHIMCRKLNLDLDHIVLKCDCFCEKKDSCCRSIIKDERVLDLLK